MSESSPPARGTSTASRVIAGVCLVVPFFAMVWVGSYAGTSPSFYWYQMAWVLGSAALTSIAYLLLRRDERRPTAPPTNKRSSAR